VDVGEYGASAGKCGASAGESHEANGGWPKQTAFRPCQAERYRVYRDP